LEREFETSTPKESRQHFELKTKVIESITNMSEEIWVEKLDSYVLCARYLYQAWCKNKTLHQHDALQIELKDFIIGNVMQIVCSDTEK
jgi:bifunctional DNA-binding transcriptional regulator/antitoxin component of YhaV-PrlF toxin-antitoxin module